MEITATVLSEKPSDIFALSVSKSKTFAECKAKYKFSYIEKLPKKERDYHIFGSYVHEILETFHQKLIDDCSRKENWQAILEEAKQEAFSNFKEKLKPEQILLANSIIKEYEEILLEEGLPNVTFVEKSFYINLMDKVLVHGFIDRIQIDNDGVIHVIDYKTSKDDKYLKNDFFQLMTYAYALMMEDPSLKRVRTSFIMLKHKFKFLTKEFTREDIVDYISGKFIKYASEIDEEKLWRPSPTALCGFCDFLEHCQAGNQYLIKTGKLKSSMIKPSVGIQKKW